MLMLRSRVLWSLLVLTLVQSPCSHGQVRTPHASTSISTPDAAALEGALAAYDAGQFARAEPVLRSLVAKYPARFEINAALGGIYAESGDPARALPFLQRACRLAPGQAAARANLGATYLKLGNVPEALRELQTAASLDSHNGATQASLGQALLANGQAEAAARALKIAAGLTPDDATVNYNLGLALYNSGAASEASAVLERIPPSERTEQVHTLAGDAAERAGKFGQALSHLQAAAQINPSDANLYAVVAELLRHWNWAEAVRVASYAEQRYPASSHFKLAEGIAQYADNRYAPAVAAFSSLLVADPDNADVADLLGRTCTLLPEGENAGCAAMYDYVERHPGNAVTTTYAAVAILHGPPGAVNLQRAQTLLETAIRAKPDYAEAYLQLGMLEQSRQNWHASAEALERSVSLRPSSPEAHWRLSRAYAHLGRHDEANQQVALSQTYAQTAKDNLNARLQEVIKFVLEPQ